MPFAYGNGSKAKAIWRCFSRADYTMCIAYLAIGAHKDWPVFIAANRDEFHQRPCQPAAPWPNRPDIIAGIDVQGGGTWLGVTTAGRYALITNYRDPGKVLADAPTRGDLVRRFLEGDTPPSEYARSLSATAGDYNGFNLIVGDLSEAVYLGNRSPDSAVVSLEPGTYILSNHLLDTPWPKAERLKQALDAYPIEHLSESLTDVFHILKDGTVADDAALPSTGLTLERERLLSSPFIVSPDYGTRCSTIVALRADGHSIFSEVSFDTLGKAIERHDWPFCLSAGIAMDA